MRGLSLNGSWAILLGLLCAVIVDQTTGLLDPAVELDLSGLREFGTPGLKEVETRSSEGPVFDTTGLRKVNPALGGAKLDFSAGGTRIDQGGNDTSIDIGESRPIVPIGAGIIWTDPVLRYVAPLTIMTSAGANYFVKLINPHSGTTAMSFYVVGGQPMTVSAPLGIYRIRYASGSHWSGESMLFGSETSTAEADADFSFIETMDGYSGYTVELIRQQGGNLETKTLSRDAF